MPNNVSQYLDYLPPILWSRHSEIDQFLPHMLRIFERILTGIPFKTEVARGKAEFERATGNEVILRNPADVGIFREGDIIAIEKNGENSIRGEISIIAHNPACIRLAEELSTEIDDGVVRIADLENGQTKIRLETAAGLLSGSSIRISQDNHNPTPLETNGRTNEWAVIQGIDGSFIHLATGLMNSYHLGDEDCSVVIENGDIDTHVVRATAVAEFLEQGQRVKLRSGRLSDFQIDDYITIWGLPEPSKITNVIADEESLEIKPFPAREETPDIFLYWTNISIADLKPEREPVFRVNQVIGLDPGMRIQITQGRIQEEAVVKEVNGHFVTLQNNLTNRYSMALGAEPIRIRFSKFRHTSVADAIEAVPYLFDVWRTPTAFLPWLASWRGVHFQPDWNEYQCRQILSKLSNQDYEVGSCSGLEAYLDLYRGIAAQPRIVLDEGTALHRAREIEDGTQRFFPVIQSQITPIEHELEDADQVSSKPTPVLLHPVAIAIDQDNRYIIADEQIPLDEDGDPQWSKSGLMLWEVSETGNIISHHSGATSAFQPIYNINHPPIRDDDNSVKILVPRAVVVDTKNQIYVIAVGEHDLSDENPEPNSAIYRFTKHDIADSTVNYEAEVYVNHAIDEKYSVIHPVDMVFASIGQRDFLFVLDRGQHYDMDKDPPNYDFKVAKPKIFMIELGDDKPKKITVSNNFPPGLVVEPTAFAKHPDFDNKFIVADAGPQSGHSNNPELLAGNLVEISLIESEDSSAKLEIDGKSLLNGISDLAYNPLIFPTAIAFEHSNVLVVSDSGLKSYASSINVRPMAEPPAIYRITLWSTPQIKEISEPKKLVYPTDLAFDHKGTLLVAERGELKRRQPSSETTVEWRARPHEFGVAMRLSRERTTSQRGRERLYQQLQSVIDLYKPGYASWWLEINQ